MLCDYGCGQKANYELQNGKKCCCKSHNSCPKVCEKRSNSLKGTRLGKDNPFYGKTHSKRGKEILRNNMLGSNNPCYKKRYSKEERNEMSRIVKKAWVDNSELKDKARKRGLDNFKNEEYLRKFIKGCSSKPNNHEKFLIKHFKNLGLNFKYVGNYKKWIGGKTQILLWAI